MEGYKDIKNCLDWIDNDISVDSIDDNTITIHKHENTLLLKLDKHQKKMDLLYNKKNILQFDIVAEDNDYIVNKYDFIEKYDVLFKLNLFELLILENMIWKKIWYCLLLVVVNSRISI